MLRLLLVLLAIAPLAAAQDVLSVIKPTAPGQGGARLGVPVGNRFTASNVSVAALIAAAYGGAFPLQESQIIGLPSWAARERFDVQARQDGAAILDEVFDDASVLKAFALVRAVLADRFALRAHEETREGAIYVLERARPQSTGLRPTAIDCAAILRAGPNGSVSGPDGRPLQPCAARTRRGAIVATGSTMAELARVLARTQGVEREVLDRTGLDGRFDFNLAWTPPLPPPGADAGAPVTEAGPSIFTALQEQLGLKLESQRGPVRGLVIDRLERPTPN
jgi:uncharacterized protein (TIGR03435 family)